MCRKLCLIPHLTHCRRGWLGPLLGFTIITVLLASAVSADLPAGRGNDGSSSAADQGWSEAEEAVLFESFLVAEQASPSDRPSAPLRPRQPPTAELPPRGAAPTSDDDPPPASRSAQEEGASSDLRPPDVATPEPDVATPGSRSPDLSIPDRGAADETRFTLFRQPRANFARRRRPIAVLGDSLVDAGQLELQYTVVDHDQWPTTTITETASVDIPLIATATRRRISKNSSVLPTDRLIFSFQHFHNALAAEISNPVTGTTREMLNLDATTIGFEKTFFDGRWSVDARLPILSRYDVSASNFTLTNGRLGNASLVLKHLWYQTDAISLGGGLGIDIPTGSDGQVILPRSEVDIANQAFHALPYLGLRIAPSEKTVLQAFGQLDVPLNSNEVEVRTAAAGTFFGEFDEQSLLFLSLSGAHWFYDAPDAARFRGLAGLLELHYTTAIEDSKPLTIRGAADSYELRNPNSRFDYLNMALGLQAQVGSTDVRTAAVVPLLKGINKAFDIELMVQINRRF